MKLSDSQQVFGFISTLIGLVLSIVVFVDTKEDAGE